MISSLHRAIEREVVRQIEIATGFEPQLEKRAHAREGNQPFQVATKFRVPAPELEGGFRTFIVTTTEGA